MHFTSITALAALATISSAASCGGFGNAKTNDARTCADLLRGKGGQPCNVPGNAAIEMCHQGSARVYGVSNNGGAQSAPCSSVAEAVDRIIAQCAVGNSVSGAETTSANGALRIELHS